MSDTTIHSTYAEAVEREVLPALGEIAGNFDTDAIAGEVIEFVEQRIDPVTGLGMIGTSGYRIRVDTETFWAIVERNALSK